MKASDVEVILESPEMRILKLEHELAIAKKDSVRLDKLQAICRQNHQAFMVANIGGVPTLMFHRTRNISTLNLRAVLDKLE